MGRPRSGRAHGLQWQTNGLRERPEFQRIPTTNILRTYMHALIKSIQIRERRSAGPSNSSPDLQLYNFDQTQIFGEGPVFRRAAQREAVEVNA